MTPRKITVYRAMSNGQWYWRVASLANGKTLADGAEGYKRRTDAVRGVLDLLGLELPDRARGVSRQTVHIPDAPRGEYAVDAIYSHGAVDQASWTTTRHGVAFTEFTLEVLP